MSATAADGGGGGDGLDNPWDARGGVGHGGVGVEFPSTEPPMAARAVPSDYEMI